MPNKPTTNKRTRLSTEECILRDARRTHDKLLRAKYILEEQVARGREALKRDENRLGAVVALIEASACMIEAGAAHPVKEATDAQ